MILLLDINHSHIDEKYITKDSVINCNTEPDRSINPDNCWWILIYDGYVSPKKYYYTSRESREADFKHLRSIRERKTMKMPFKTRTGNIIDLNKVSRIYPGCWRHNKKQFTIEIYIDNREHSSTVCYEKESDRDEDYEEIEGLIFNRDNNKKHNKKEKKGISMIESVKNFYKEHENVLFPLFMLIGLDYLFNDGRFQGKISQAIENIIDGISKKSE
jgi:hypothetical protein